MKILDGRIVRDKIADKLKTLNSKLETKPKLVIIQVGDLAESNSYIRQKILFGQKIGAIVGHQKFPNNIREEKLITHISSLNTDPTVTGIIVQMPLPDHLDKDKIIESITPVKDVDGLTSTNLKLLWEGPSFRHSERSEESKTRSFASAQDDNGRFNGYTPATTRGVLTLLDYYKIPISGKHVVVVGRSFLVGKPTVLAFLNRDATVTICHSKTRNLKQETRKADILVVAAGKPNLITKDHVRAGQVVVDVGINLVNYSSSEAQAESRSSRQARTITSESQINDKRSTNLVGDVDFDQVSKIVAAITPVPGGIGPMTVASLFENLLEAHRRQIQKGIDPL